jgi:hypothetical protein
VYSDDASGASVVFRSATEPFDTSTPVGTYPSILGCIT